MTRNWIYLALVSLVGCKVNLGRMADDMTNAPAVDMATGDMLMDYTGLDIEPADLQTITVAAGGATPTVAYMATLLGTPILLRWSVDRGDVGTIDTGTTSTATFAPRGSTGGLVTVIGSIGGTTIKRQVMVKLTTTPQNGFNPSEMNQVPTTVASIKTGGGVGGVGGEGLGVAVSDAPTISALATPTSDGSAQHLSFLYPYDKTVWPRGMLAPLLMWKWDTGDADAAKIDLSTTSGSFTWTGTFGKPTILGSTAGNFIRHPIPQDVWDMATNSAGGLTPDGKQDKLTVKLTISKAGVAYGPISETWGVARARLTGAVYYNTYGTQQILNFSTPDPMGHYFGAAIMGIHLGDSAPKVVVGTASCTPGGSCNNGGCRVCHTVASKGRWLIAQSGNDYYSSYAYDLSAANVPASAVPMQPDGTFAWAGMVSDGSYALGNTANPTSQAPSISGQTSGFWEFGAQIQPMTNYGLLSTLSAAYPSFSPDDKYVAYIDSTGHSTNPTGPLVVASYDKSAKMFGTPQTVYTPPAGTKIGFPAFLPDNSGVIFTSEVRAGSGISTMTTTNGARSEFWWIKSGATAPVLLDAVNGKSGAATYLPIAAMNHGIGQTGDPEYGQADTFDDTTLNYEGTIAPVLTGGYAWMVFTSRRMYGNMLTSFPWKSDGRQYDITDINLATTKKLWVAAISLGGSADADPSFPAFYLPAQELLAGNSRAFWALDPCQGDGNSCDTGDQCCGGCCQPNGNAGALICQSPPPDGHCSAVSGCSGVQEKCVTTADCCDGTNQCVNGFCAQVIN